MLTRIGGGFLAVLVLILGSLPLAAQSAPRETVSLVVGSGKVSVEYGRPSLKGRNVEDLLKELPEDRIWRTGADQITTLTTEVPFQLGGKLVPPGKYSVYLHCPVSGNYSLVLNKVLGQPLKNIYSEAPPSMADAPWPHYNYEKEIGAQEAARGSMKMSRTASPSDLFTISLKPAQAGATFEMAWGNQTWSVVLQATSSEGSRPEGSYR